MKIRRTIPPAAALLGAGDLMHGIAGMFSRERHYKRLVRELKEYFSARHVFAVSSGKAALTVILRALKALSPGKSGVIIPAYTCFSVPSAIVRAGLQVELCDIGKSTFDFDKEKLSRAITKNTLCVVPGHMFGVPSDMELIARICRDRGVYLIEDAAQAMGGAIRGKKFGTLGDAGFFSLGRGKNITCGSGGIILTNSDAIAGGIEQDYSSLKQPGRAEELHQLLKAVLLSIFIRPSLYWLPAGLPSLKLGQTIFCRDFAIKRISGLQAGLLRRWQSRLELSNRARRENADYFCRHLGLKFGNGLPRPLLRVPVLAEEPGKRDGICAVSRERGLGISSMYPAPVNRIRELEDRFAGMSFPNAERISGRIMTLPTHELLSSRDKLEIVRLLMNMKKSGGQVSHE